MRTFTCIVDKTNTPPAFLRILTDMDASASTRVITWDSFKVTWRFTEAKVVPEKLRTLDHGRPWRDDQFASTRLSSSRDMSR